MKVKRSLTSILFQENEIKSLEIPRDNIIENINLILEITLTNNGAAAVDVSSIQPHIFAKLAKRVEVIANGKISLFSQPFRDIVLLDNFEHGIEPYSVNPGSIAAGATATVKVGAKLDFATKHALNEYATVLIAPSLSTLDLKITWGKSSDIDGLSTDLTIVSAKMIPTLTELTEIEEIETLVKQERFIYKKLPLSDSASVDLPTGTLIRRIALIPVDETDIRENIETVKLVLNGTDVIRQIDTDSLALENLQFYKNNNLPFNHCLILNFDEDGDLADLVDGEGASSIKLEFKTLTDNYEINIHLQEIL